MSEEELGAIIETVEWLRFKAHRYKGTGSTWAETKNPHARALAMEALAVELEARLATAGVVRMPAPESKP